MFTRLLKILGFDSKGSAHVLHVPDVKFLAEQDGPVEQQLKALWAPVLQRYGIAKAYLVRVQFPGQPVPTIALAMTRGPFSDEDVVSALSPTFNSIMSQSNFVDMLFLSSDQEARAASVCRSFLHAA